MAKIKLDVDALQVESFDTAPAADARGTVQGHQIVGTNTCMSVQETCAGYNCTLQTLCLVSCQMLCEMSAQEGPEVIG
jgi:hypothetical protein